MEQLDEQQKELRELAGEHVPTMCYLQDNLNDLKSTAEKQRDSLEEAKKEQQKYETDVNMLKDQIKDSTRKLSSPIKGADLEALRQQITDHTVSFYAIVFFSLFFHHFIYILCVFHFVFSVCILS